jgi:ABC-type transport system involved in multi-copper enzyme maturation permease subunit
MYRDYCLAMENYEILQSKSNEPIAVIRPTPLSIFARGLDENLRRSHEVHIDGIEINKRQKSVNNLFKLFAPPDLLYIIKVILSLCAMLFAYDMVSGEKETGTLRQSLSNSLKRPILIFGKWIGGFASFILPFFIAVLLGTILVTLSPMVDINARNWAQMGLFLLSSVIYLSVFFSLGLLISCLTHQSSSSLVISLFVWTILVFLIPNLGNILARQFVRIPTAQQVELKREQTKKKFNSEYNRIKFLFEIKKIPKTKQDFIKRAEVLVGRFAAELDKLDEDYRNSFNSLVRLSQNITRFSPTAAFTFLATDIMGTGMTEERRLKNAIFLYMNIVRNNEKSNRPAFSYQRSSVREVLGQEGMGNCLILTLFNILFFTGAIVTFLRYDVR